MAFLLLLDSQRIIQERTNSKITDSNLSSKILLYEVDNGGTFEELKGSYHGDGNSCRSADIYLLPPEK